MKYLKRGEVYYIDLGNNVGSEVNKERPCLIIQNNIGNKYSPTTIILPISNGGKKSLPTHIEIEPWMIENGLTSIKGTVLAEQVRTVDKRRIKSKLGAITKDALLNIDSAMLLSIGIQMR